MNRFRAMFSILVGAVIVVCSIPTTYAHEVYVLNPDEITLGIHAARPDFWATITTHLSQFTGAALLTLGVIIAAYFLSVAKPFENLIDPFLYRLKRAAPIIAQITLGLSLLASGYYRAVFGVELPIKGAFPTATAFVTVLLIVLGIMLLTGFLPRLAGIGALVLFIILCGRYGIYMTNYATYAGEALTMVFFGGAYLLHPKLSLAHLFSKIIDERWLQYKFLIIRVLFGISLVYASVYAKFLHGALALETVSKYHLTNFFPFDPVFLVLGAMFIEILLGLFFLLGFEIRFASLFFLVFLVLSLVFFKEAVWPHFMLIGTALSMFCHGYDKYSLSVRLNRKNTLEPVL